MGTINTKWRAIALAISGLAGCALVACDGGCRGGGTCPIYAPDPVPILIRATFVGTGSSPTAGDRIQLFLSEDVTLRVGSTVFDRDFTVSTGATR